ncbi:sugar transporter SWEET1 [Lycorma delicatula]|uniref:sugar transporter SWEET1 n=1 Tax=Lycorma delicatula TaxID=130591 RepID=UPI003F50E87E
MALSEFKELLATTATVSAIMQFMSGAIVVQKYVLKGTAENESGFPFMSGFLSCMLWARYGFMIDDLAMVFVNLTGVTLMLIYGGVHYKYTPRKKVVLRQLLVVLIVMTLAHGYTIYETDSEIASTRFGFLTCCTTLVFFGSPLTNLAHVLRVKSTEILPFPLIIMTWFVSAQWYLYGIIINDSFVQYPNLIGCILATFQLLLFIIYPSRKQNVQDNFYQKQEKAYFNLI